MPPFLVEVSHEELLADGRAGSSGAGDPMTAGTLAQRVEPVERAGSTGG
jgi:hypothetical protein